MAHKISKEVSLLLEMPHVKNWRLLMGAFDRVRREIEIELSANGLSISRFQVLFLLYTEDFMAPVEIAKRMLVTRANISTFLKRMKTDGLIIECPNSKSSKRPCFRLTQQGIKDFESVFPKHVDVLKKFVPAFSQKTNLELLAIVERHR